MNDADRIRRAEFRAFVRQHHPDVGGDPDMFVRGLHKFYENHAAGIAAPSDTITQFRYDSPVSFVNHRSTVHRAIRSLANWRRRKHNPRVR